MGSTTKIRVARRHSRFPARPPRSKKAGVQVLRYDELTPQQRRLLERDFQREVLPALTPMALGPGHPFPRVADQSLNLAVMLREPGRAERFGSLTVPAMFPRRWRIPGQPESGKYVWLEEMVAANVDSLFPGLEILSTSPFRITRADSARTGGQGASLRLLPARSRRGPETAGTVLRLEVERRMPRSARDLLIRKLGIQPEQAIAVDGPLQRA